MVRIFCACAVCALAVLAASPLARDRVTDSEIVMLKRVTPPFPLEAYAACTPGYVLVEFTIGTDGEVRDIDVLESEPPGVFDSVTTDAVSQWRFSPRIVNGEAVEDRVAQQIDFTISSECEVGAELPDDYDAVETVDEDASRERCMLRGGARFGVAELNFRIDDNGRPSDVVVVRDTGAEYVRRAREQLAERSFDPSYEALTFSHTWMFCLTEE